MVLTSIPDPADQNAIFELAMTFDGYEHFGSFEACAEAASSGDRSTLELLKNELFLPPVHPVTEETTISSTSMPS